MRIMARVALVVVALASAFAVATTITPTTTLAIETGNNTSAADTWTTSINSDMQAGNVSKVDHHTLLYPGATTPIYTNIMYWFGKRNHIAVGYNSGDVAQVRKQVDDHVSRGLDGTIVDWYGQDHTLDNGATIAMMNYAESLPGLPFKFAIMEDVGALRHCANTAGCDITQQLITDLTYIHDTFATSPAYITIGGRPVLFFFGLEQYTIDWKYVKSQVPGNMVYIFENQSSFSDAKADGGFAWVQLNIPSPADWNHAYLDDYYLTAKRHAPAPSFGATYKGFNDGLASWSLDRVMGQDCGQTWLNTWAEANRHYSPAHPLEAMQIVTWNDYEEGTEIESGIDNCVSVTAAVSGSSLSWEIAGGLENTIDHYEVFASLDAQNLAQLVTVSAGIHDIDLNQFELDPAPYTLYVKAVGKPSITNKMSGPVTFSSDVADAASLVVPGPAPVIVPGSLTVVSPAGQSTVASVVHFVANATPPTGHSISAIRVYVSGQKVYGIDGPSMDTYLTLTPGTHQVIVKAWDSTGQMYRWVTNLTVID